MLPFGCHIQGHGGWLAKGKLVIWLKGKRKDKKLSKGIPRKNKKKQSVHSGWDKYCVMTYSFQSAQCHVGLKLPFRVYCLPNWLVKRYCLLLLDVWILTKTVLISLENARRGPIRRCTNLQERVQWLHLKRFEPRRIKVGRWNELVRAKRCDAVDWDSA